MTLGYLFLYKALCFPASFLRILGCNLLVDRFLLSRIGCKVPLLFQSYFFFI